ncbi:hypothetical protein Dimus_024392 [Dionaea muscipula]
MAMHSIVGAPRPLSLPPSLFQSLPFSSGFGTVNPLLTPIRLNCPLTRSGHQVYKRTMSTVDFERSNSGLNWFNLWRMISSVKGTEMGVASLLDELERDGKKLSKWVLCRVAKQLRKYKKWEFALQVCEWMHDRAYVYGLLSTDMAIRLDLIAQVHGISRAEDYFLRIPDAGKDRNVYGALLHVYVRARKREKAEHLMEKARKLGFADSSLKFNVMMTLYLRLKEYDKVESLILEMKQKNIGLDLYSYNIWLSARGSRGSAEGMEEVLALITSDPAVEPHWTTFGAMATSYARLGHLEKAVDCLKSLESSIKNRERKTYHYLLSLYASIGDKAAIHRVWDTYQSIFPRNSNLGYQVMISSLIRLGDIEEAEKIYEEWLSTKPIYCDPSVANHLIHWHIEEGFFEKAKMHLYQMAEVGGKPNANTWDILTKGHIREGRISEALSCLKEALLVSRSWRNWRPNGANVAAMLELIERDGDESSRVTLIGLLREFGYWEDEGYRMVLSKYGVIIVGEKDIQFANRKSDVMADDDDDYNQIETEGSELIPSVP